MHYYLVSRTDVSNRIYIGEFTDTLAAIAWVNATYPATWSRDRRVASWDSLKGGVR